MEILQDKSHNKEQCSLGSVCCGLTVAGEDLWSSFPSSWRSKDTLWCPFIISKPIMFPLIFLNE